MSRDDGRPSHGPGRAHLARALAVVTTALVLGLAPGAARAGDCAPRYDPAQCFCPGVLLEYGIDAVYVGRITSSPDDPNFALRVEEVYAATGTEVAYDEGDLFPLVDVPSHLTSDRFIAYHTPFYPYSPPLVEIVDASLTRGTMSRFLDIDVRYCTAALPYDAVATALVSDDCWTTIRELADVPPRSPPCSTSACAGASEGGAWSGLSALLALGLLARRRRSLGLATSGHGGAA